MRSKSVQRRLKHQQGEDYAYDNAGVEDIHLHEKGCAVWWAYDCDCIHSVAGLEDMYLGDEYEPPERVSKSAKPTMGISGKSIFTILREIGKRGKK